MLSPSWLVEMTKLTLFQPRDAARMVKALGLPSVVVWSLFGLAAILGGVTSLLVVWLLSVSFPEIQAASTSPIVFAVLAAVSMLVTAFAWVGAGRVMEGSGRFDQALVLLVWLQLVFVGLQWLVLISLVLVPVVGAILGLAVGLLALRATAAFIAELHGFAGWGRAIATLILSVVAILIFDTMLNALLGTSV